MDIKIPNLKTYSNSNLYTTTLRNISIKEPQRTLIKWKQGKLWKLIFCRHNVLSLTSCVSHTGKSGALPPPGERPWWCEDDINKIHEGKTLGLSFMKVTKQSWHLTVLKTPILQLKKTKHFDFEYDMIHEWDIIQKLSF